MTSEKILDFIKSKNILKNKGGFKYEIIDDKLIVEVHSLKKNNKLYYINIHEFTTNELNKTNIN